MNNIFCLLFLLAAVSVRLFPQEHLRINKENNNADHFVPGRITNITFSDLHYEWLKVNYQDGTEHVFDLSSVSDLAFSDLSGIEGHEEILSKLGITLLSNYPNPFNPETTISFTIDTPGLTRVDIYNHSGQLVTTLHEGEMSSGSHSMKWNALEHNASTGVYLLRVSQKGKQLSSKMLLVK
jgi:hypothetical protein